MPLNKDYITDALALIDALDISASDEVLYDLAARLNKTNAGKSSIIKIHGRELRRNSRPREAHLMI